MMGPLVSFPLLALGVKTPGEGLAIARALSLDLWGSDTLGHHLDFVFGEWVGF